MDPLLLGGSYRLMTRPKILKCMYIKLLKEELEDIKG